MAATSVRAATPTTSSADDPGLGSVGRVVPQMASARTLIQMVCQR